MFLNLFNHSVTCLHLSLGLKLNLFIEQSQYIPELSDTAGARVVVHDQGQIPFPNNEGYSVLPSRSTSFGIRRVRREVYILPKKFTYSGRSDWFNLGKLMRTGR